MLLSPPLSLVAYVLTDREVRASNDRSSHFSSARSSNSPISLENLPFVLLTALHNGATCLCRLATRVQSSSAIFLAVGRRHFESTLGELEIAGLIERAAEPQCSCKTAYSISTKGGLHLDDCLRYCRITGLVGSPVLNAPRGEV
jgi:hypothetical protein